MRDVFLTLTTYFYRVNTFFVILDLRHSSIVRLICLDLITYASNPRSTQITYHGAQILKPWSFLIKFDLPSDYQSHFKAIYADCLWNLTKLEFFYWMHVSSSYLNDQSLYHLPLYLFINSYRGLALNNFMKCKQDKSEITLCSENIRRHE